MSVGPGRLVDRLRVHLRTWLRRTRAERELMEELQFHLDRDTTQRVAAGADAEEARRAALRAMGGVEQVKEHVRDAWGLRWLANLRQDLRYALRVLRANPGFAATAILTVAIGVGATTAIFSIVYGVMLRPLPYPEPSRLVALWTKNVRTGIGHTLVAAADHRDWREQNRVFEDIALVRNIANLNLTEGGEPERINGGRITANLLPILGVTPLIGRNFLPEEESPRGTASNVVLLGYDLWQRRFNGDPSIVGTSIRISSQSYLVAGVMKPDFHYPTREYEMWVPLTINPDDFRTRGAHMFTAVARLKPGITLEQARADMDRVAARLAAQYPNTNTTRGVQVEPLLADTVEAVRLTLSVLLAAVGCVLLIGCANLANLLLARAAHRSHELTVRAALGASRGRLVAQSMTELMPILVLGGLLGVLVASWLLRGIVPLLPATMPRVEDIAINVPVLAFTAGVLALTGLLCGLIPSLMTARLDLATSMKDSARGASAGHARTRMRRGLVVAQIAIVVPLLVAATLLARTLGELKGIDPGFRADRVLSMLLAISRTKYTSDRAIAEFERRLLERIQGLPGVESVGGVNRLPFGGSSSFQIGPLEFEGTDCAVNSIGDTDWRTATPDYFKTLRIPILQGRSFTDSDTDGAKLVGIIDERIARTVWPGRKDIIGRRYRMGFPDSPWIEIVGVAGQLRHAGLDVDPRPTAYWNYQQRTQDRVALAIRTTGGDPRQLIAPVLAALREVDPEQPAYDVQTMDALLDRSLAQRWLNMLLLIGFAGASLTLASIGLYGVMAYAVTQRSREFGIRLALGGRPRDIVRLVITQAARLAIAGALIGLAAAWLASRALQSLLFNVPARDVASFAASTLVLAAVALLASWLPARRAARVDPIRTLRAE
jgi:putative ABC transport system permease protein